MDDSVLRLLLESDSLDMLLKLTGIVVLVMGFNHIKDFIGSVIKGYQKMISYTNGKVVDSENYAGPERRQCQYDDETVRVMQEHQKKISRNLEEASKNLADMSHHVKETRTDVKEIRDDVKALRL